MADPITHTQRVQHPYTIRSMWSDCGRRTTEYCSFPDYGGRNYRQRLLEIPVMAQVLRLQRRADILEVGCGRGTGLGALARTLRPHRLVGLDVNREFLEEAEATLARTGVEAELIPGDIRFMPFRNASFDMVIDFGTCYHIGYAECALAEVHRVLRCGGVFAYETRVSQMLSHPIRSFARTMPFDALPQLRKDRWRLLWAARRKVLP